MRTSRRFHLNLPSELESDLTLFARRRGLALGPAMRLLLGGALQSDADHPTALVDSPAALAALTAAEHTLLVVASVMPEGESRVRSLAGRAVEAAEERLTLFRPGENA